MTNSDELYIGWREAASMLQMQPRQLRELLIHDDVPVVPKGKDAKYAWVVRRDLFDEWRNVTGPRKHCLSSKKRAMRVRRNAISEASLPDFLFKDGRRPASRTGAQARKPGRSASA